MTTLLKSHVVGASEPPLLDITIGEALAQAAERWGDRPALISIADDVRLTFAQLDAAASSLARGLANLGLKPGDRIGIWSPNNARWAILQFAAARAGLILVTINPAYRMSELEYCLNKLGIAALVAAESFRTSDYVAMVEGLAPEIATCAAGELAAARTPDLRILIKIAGAPRHGWIDFDAVSRAGDGPPAVTSPTEAVNVQFTSGTTGLPKGATLTHRNILNNGYMVGRAVGLEVGDRLCIPVPLYHCFGMVMGNLACLTHGAAMVYPAEGFDPVATLNAIAAERCTHVYGVPTMFIAMLGSPDFDSFDLTSLRGGCMAGAPCPVEIMRQVIERMHMDQVTIAYGMTETSPVSFQTGRDDGIEQRISTVGRIQPHLESRIVGADGETLARGETGELCTRGYAVMLGYWGEPGQTAAAIDAEGWMHTGDLGVIDEAGYCRIVGRIKDMVIRGGENIYPREIEEFLHGHPDIEDVAVVGVPDARFGEELCAWVRLRPGASLAPADVVAHCRGQIAHYKIPRYVRIVEEFPVTVTGKVQKFLIREQMIAELATEGA